MLKKAVRKDGLFFMVVEGIDVRQILLKKFSQIKGKLYENFKIKNYLETFMYKEIQ